MESQESWLLDEDPVVSARKFLKTKGEESFVSILKVEAEPGTEVLAFQVNNLIKECATRTLELGMDSTCK